MTTLQHRPDPDTAGAGEASGPADEQTSGGGRPWLIVAVREVVVRVTNRTFLFSTLFTLVFIAGFAAFSAGQAGKTTTYTIAVSSAEGTRLVEPHRRHHPEHGPGRGRGARRRRPGRRRRVAARDVGRLDADVRRRRGGVAADAPRGSRPRRCARPQRGCGRHDGRGPRARGDPGRRPLRRADDEPRLRAGRHLRLRAALLHGRPDVRPADRRERRRG